MKITVLDSGSHGNCYVLQNDQEAIVIEAGCHVQEVLETLNFNTRKVVGVFISHAHLDHMRYVEDYLKYFPCYCSQGAIDEFRFKKQRRPIAMTPLRTVTFGGFSVRPFDTEHDAKEPIGFLIEHEETGKILFVTDSYFVKYQFDGLNIIMLECNYDLQILQENCQKGIIPKKLEERTLESHMSLEHCKQMLRATDLTDVSRIILLHLSKNNADPIRFKKEIELLTGKYVHVAQRGLELPINIIPF